MICGLYCFVVVVIDCSISIHESAESLSLSLVLNSSVHYYVLRLIEGWILVASTAALLKRNNSCPPFMAIPNPKRFLRTFGLQSHYPHMNPGAEPIRSPQTLMCVRLRMKRVVVYSLSDHLYIPHR